MTENERIEMAKKDPVHFGALYEQYFDIIYRFIYQRLGGNEAEAGDLCQQTFLKAMTNIENYEDRGSPFVSWLYRIAQNEINMFFRKLSNERLAEIEEKKFASFVSEKDLNEYMTVCEQEKLVKLLNQLTEEQLNLVELRFFHGLGFKEIASICEITEANAKMKIYRILEKLFKKWNDVP